MAQCKTAVSPLLTLSIYCSLALSHRYHLTVSLLKVATVYASVLDLLNILQTMLKIPAARVTTEDCICGGAPARMMYVTLAQPRIYYIDVAELNCYLNKVGVFWCKQRDVISGYCACKIIYKIWAWICCIVAWTHLALLFACKFCAYILIRMCGYIAFIHYNTVLIPAMQYSILIYMHLYKAYVSCK